MCHILYSTTIHITRYKELQVLKMICSTDLGQLNLQIYILFIKPVNRRQLTKYGASTQGIINCKGTETFSKLLRELKPTARVVQQ